MSKLTIQPMGTQVDVEDGANLRKVLIDNGIAVKSTCGGCVSCGQCVVVIKEGTEFTSEIKFEEQQLLGNIYHLTGERLSCQVTISGDLSVDVSDHIEKKAAVKTHRRTKEEADQVVADRHAKSKEKPKKQGGRKRPKAF